MKTTGNIKPVIEPKNISTDIVRSFYYVEFDQAKKTNSGVIIDDSCYELMFVKEKNVKLVDGDNVTHSIPPCYTLNNLKNPFRFEFPESFSSFCIKLQPWMNTTFVPTKQSQLLDLNLLYPKYMDQLHQDLFNANTVEEMAEYAEQFLLAIDIRPNKDTELIKNICQLIYLKQGNITVNEIAEQYNIYRQKLNALFKQEVKYTLKTFINNIRIRACLKYKLQNPEVLLTEIGHQFGYFDQAHFIRSFKSACGITPSEYVKTPGYSFAPPNPKKEA